MSRTTSAVAVLFCLFSINIALASDSGKKTDSPWLDSWDKAAAAAKASNKPILVSFTGSDWCYWCQKLDSEVFSTRAFQDWADKNVILLKVDFPRRVQEAAVKKQNNDLAKKYEIEGFPTVVFLDSGGRELGRSGYKAGGPEKWTARADQAIKN